MGARCAVLRRIHRLAFPDPNPALLLGDINMIRSRPYSLTTQEIRTGQHAHYGVQHVGIFLQQRDSVWESELCAQRRSNRYNTAA